MLTAEAHVQTSQPGRYLIQLCRHAQQIHRLRHSPRPHDGGDARPAPTVQHVEWSQTRGTISFGWGQCTMQATPGRLTLRVEAADAEHLQRLQEIVATDIERFGRRDQLKVNWQRPGAPIVQPSAAGQAHYPPGN